MGTPDRFQADERMGSPDVFQADETTENEVHIEDLQISLAFVNALKTATLDDSGLPPGIIHQLRHPIEEPLGEIHPDLRLGLDLFLCVSNASEDTYRTARLAFQRHSPHVEIPTYERIKSKLTELTGVSPITHHMCRNSCIAYTGPFAELADCPECGEPRYDPLTPGKQRPRQTFSTMPLGPQLQALYRTPEQAEAMQYRVQETERILTEIAETGEVSTFGDVFHGHEYLQAVHRGDIKGDDITLMLSIDGAQLYESKQSDCWIYIWVILDHAPDTRYKKTRVYYGGSIPGPNKPGNVDSFLFPGLYHVAALQIEGLRIWNSFKNQIVTSSLYFLLGTADGPGMTYLNGLVGYKSAFRCQFYCPFKGHREFRKTQYHPAHLKPNDYDVPGCNHPDIDVAHLQQASHAEYQTNLAFLLASPNLTQYKKRRRDTGIAYPSIFSGFSPTRMLEPPGCFAADLMHLASLNITELLLSLWRATLECHPDDSKRTWDWAVLQGDLWIRHGKAVADCKPYLPGSFEQPPRNIAEKINSQYKAREFLTYIYGLGPGLFYRLLPEKYWIHFCKLVKAIRIFHQ